MNTLLKKLLFSAGIFLLFMFTIHRVVFFNQPGLSEKITSIICYPFMCVSTYFSNKINLMTTTKENYKTLEQKHKKLYDDYMEMLDELIKAKASLKAYNELKPLIDFKTRYAQEKAIVAKVLMRNLSSSEHYFIVNQGSNTGVVKDMIALFQNHLIGRVYEVYPLYSKVMLITDQRSRVSVYTGQTNSRGIVQGFNNGNRCQLCYVSHLCTLNDHDLVVSSGQGLIFPEGFCLGKIVLHSLEDKALYHYIEIEPFVPFESITYCHLVLGSNITFF